VRPGFKSRAPDQILSSDSSNRWSQHDNIDVLLQQFCSSVCSIAMMTAKVADVDGQARTAADLRRAQLNSSGHQGTLLDAKTACGLEFPKMLSLASPIGTSPRLGPVQILAAVARARLPAQA